VTGIIEALAYAIAKGATRACLDVLRERETFTPEMRTDEDATRIDSFRAAVDRLQSVAAAPRTDGPNDSASGRAPRVG